MIRSILCISFLFILISSNCSRKNERNVVNNSSSNVNVESLPQFESIAFSGTNIVWLVTRKGELLHTSDGGASWRVIPSSIVGEVGAISFINSQHGWVVNKQGQVWLTENNGQTWVKLSAVAGKGAFTTPREILFIDELHGWVGDDFSIWRTEDGGMSWQLSLSAANRKQDKTWQPTHITFINPALGWVSSTNGIVHHTVDGGKTWQTRDIMEHADLRSINFINANLGWMSGAPGGIYQSSDGGQTWRQLDEMRPLYLDSVYFVSEREGWAVGWKYGAENESRRQGVVLRTFDGGLSWQPLQVGNNETFFNQIYFADTQHGWLVARDNIYRTTDGGASWLMVMSLPPIKSI